MDQRAISQASKVKWERIRTAILARTGNENLARQFADASVKPSLEELIKRGR